MENIIISLTDHQNIVERLKSHRLSLDLETVLIDMKSRSRSSQWIFDVMIYNSSLQKQNGIIIDVSNQYTNRESVVRVNRVS